MLSDVESPNGCDAAAILTGNFISSVFQNPNNTKHPNIVQLRLFDVPEVVPVLLERLSLAQEPESEHQVHR